MNNNSIPKVKINGFFFLIASFLGLIAHGAFSYSVIIYCQDVLHSTTCSSIAFAVIYLPVIALSLLAGVFSDTFSRKKILLLSHLGLSIVLGTMTFVIAAFSLSIFILLGFCILYGILVSFVPPARYSFVSDFFDAQGVEKVTIFLSVLVILAFALAPVLVGIIKQHTGWVPLFSCIMFSWIGALLFFMFIKINEKHGLSQSENFLKKLVEVNILQNNHLQTGCEMSISPIRILADFDKNATSYHHPW